MVVVAVVLVVLTEDVEGLERSGEALCDAVQLGHVLLLSCEMLEALEGVVGEGHCVEIVIRLNSMLLLRRRLSPRARMAYIP